MINKYFVQCIVNWENFVYENIHVLNIRVNKFSRVPHENILTRKFVQVEITVHISPIELLLSTYMPLYVATEAAKMQSNPAVQCVIHCNRRY